MEVSELTDLLNATANILDELGFKEWLTACLLPKIAHLPEQERQVIIDKAKEIHEAVHQNFRIQQTLTNSIIRNAKAEDG